MIIFDNFSTNYWLVFFILFDVYWPIWAQYGLFVTFFRCTEGLTNRVFQKDHFKGSDMPRAPWSTFEKRIVQGYQKWYFHESNMQIQKYKYTNTAYDKVPERPNMLYIFEERIVQGYQNDIPMSQIGEYKNTNLWLTNAKKTQHVVYLWREECSWIILSHAWLYKV